MTSKTPALAGGVFGVERAGDTIIVVPAVDLRALDYRRIEAGARAALELLHGPGVRNVVVDFGGSDSYGSGAIGSFLRFWRAVREQGGRMAFCNLSANEKELLRATSVDRLCPVCPSRGEALEAVRGNERSSAC